MADPSKAVAAYVDLLGTDRAINYEHKHVWNQIVLGEIK